MHTISSFLRGTHLIADSKFQCFQAANLGAVMLLSGELNNLQAGIPHNALSINAPQIKLLAKVAPHEVLSGSPELLKKPTADTLISFQQLL